MKMILITYDNGEFTATDHRELVIENQEKLYSGKEVEPHAIVGCVNDFNEAAIKIEWMKKIQGEIA